MHSPAWGKWRGREELNPEVRRGCILQGAAGGDQKVFLQNTGCVFILSYWIRDLGLFSLFSSATRELRSRLVDASGSCSTFSGPVSGDS